MDQHEAYEEEDFLCPPFLFYEADEWFNELEEEFCRHSIYDDEVRMRHVLGELNTTWTREIQSVLRDSKLDNKYAIIKQYILCQFYSANLKRFELLNRYEPPPNMRPSKVYREIIKIAPAGTTYTNLEKKWLSMFKQYEKLFEEARPCSFDTLMEIADRIWRRENSRN